MHDYKVPEAKWETHTEYGRGSRDGWEGRAIDSGGGVKYRDGYADGADDKGLDDGDGPTWDYVGPERGSAPLTPA